jgi:hypothetical protein
MRRPPHKLDGVLRTSVLSVFFATTVVAAGLARTHVHDYAEHDHPEHHHGPAAHSHARHQAVHVPDLAGQRSMGPCDAGDHAVSVQATAIAAKPFAPMFVAVLVNASPPAGIRQPVTVRRADVRVHGPPPDTPSAPRAPPVVHPA